LTIYHDPRTWSLVTFEPADGPPVGFRCDLVYLTEVRGVRVAFLQTYMMTGEPANKSLRTGQVGRLTIFNPDVVDPEGRHGIPIGMLTCISNVSQVKNAVIQTYVITEVGPPPPI
jgi:hypothetical protein